MVTLSASFSFKVAQALPVKGKESLGSVAKKASKKKSDDRAPSMPARQAMEVVNMAINDDVNSPPPPTDSPSLLASLTPNAQPGNKTMDIASSTPTLVTSPQSSTPSTQKHAKSVVAESMATPTCHNLSLASCPH